MLKATLSKQFELHQGFLHRHAQPCSTIFTTWATCTVIAFAGGVWRGQEFGRALYVASAYDCHVFGLGALGSDSDHCTHVLTPHSAGGSQVNCQKWMHYGSDHRIMSQGTCLERSHGRRVPPQAMAASSTMKAAQANVRPQALPYQPEAATHCIGSRDI
jgi:hypothetical protein